MSSARVGTTRVTGWVLMRLVFGCALAFGALCFALVSVTAQSDKAKDSKSPKESPISYRDAKARDSLSFDFQLVAPEGVSGQGLTPVELQLIQSTIKGGCERLLAAQRSDGVFSHPTNGKYVTGAHALTLWALLDCGQSTTSRPIQKAIAALLTYAQDPPKIFDYHEWPPGWTMADRLETYEASLILMALHALAEARLRETEDKDELSRSQIPAGHRTTEDHIRRATLLKSKLTDVERSVGVATWKSLVERQKPDGQWGYSALPKYVPDDEKRRELFARMLTDTDESNSHFAILGLLAAFRCGLGAPPAHVLEKAANAWLVRQIQFGVAAPIRFSPPPGDLAKRQSGTRAARGSDAKARWWGYTRTEGVDLQSVLMRTGPRLAMSAAGVIGLSSIRHMAMGGATQGPSCMSLEALDRGLIDGLAYLSKALSAEVVGESAAQAESDRLRKQHAKRPPSADVDREALIREAAERERFKAYAKSYGVPLEGILLKRMEDAIKGERPGRDFPNSPTAYDGYGMLAIERAGILTGNDFFGECEWYVVGARSLIEHLAELRPASKPDKAKKAGKKGDVPEKKKDEFPARRHPARTPEQEAEMRRNEVMQASSVELRSRANLSMELLFLKGYLDKTRTGPAITGGGKPLPEKAEEDEGDKGSERGKDNPAPAETPKSD